MTRHLSAIMGLVLALFISACAPPTGSPPSEATTNGRTAEERISPMDARILSDATRMALGAGQFDVALADCNKLIEVLCDADGRLLPQVQADPFWKEENVDPYKVVVQAYANRAVARAGKGDRKGAIADCDTAVQLNPMLPEVLINRALWKLQEGDLDGALADSDKARGLNPALANAKTRRSLIGEAYEARGQNREKAGDFAGAIADLTKAIQVEPNSARAYADRGRSKFKAGDSSGAIADLTKAIQIRPDFAEAYVGRSVVKLARGDKDGAAADMNKALELRPK